MLNRLFNFNGHDLGLLVTVESVERPLIQQDLVWAGFVDRPDMVLTSRLAKKPIQVNIRAIECSRKYREELELVLAPLLVTKKPAKLELYDRLGKYDIAIVDGSVDWERFRHTGRTTIPFVSPYPYMFRYVKPQVYNVGPNSPLKLKYKGTANVSPLLEITGVSGKGLKIEHDKGHIELNRTFQTAEITKIDNENMDVYIGSIESGMPYLTLQSEWIELEQGENILTFSKTAKATVTYLERWIG